MPFLIYIGKQIVLDPRKRNAEEQDCKAGTVNKKTSNDRFKQ